MEVTDFEKRIYNAFLVASRRAVNKPFRLRQDFSDIKPEVYTALKKLSAFFLDNPTVNINDFFTAPYKLYEDPGYLSIESFLKRTAITWYTLYMANKRCADPDADDALADTVKAFKFVLEYCVKEKITLAQYKTKTEKDIPVCLLHLRSNDINFYLIHSLDIQRILYNIGVDWLDFYISNFDGIFRETLTKYRRSTKTKKLAATAIIRINNKLNEYE